MNSDGEKIDQHVQLVRLLMERDEVGVEDAIALAGALIPAEDRDAVLERWTQQTSIRIEVLDPINLSELGGPRPWYADYDPARGYYWRRQRLFLAQGLKRRDFEIDSLDKSSSTVLSHLEDPRCAEPFLVKGLVIGYIQSGKTANFSALIAKAADAGYKVVIVLSGLHNTLRQQTQRRLQRDLGRDFGTGVGSPEPGRQWVWMTGPELWEDFNPGSVDGALLQGNEQVILVVKKNKSRLLRLIDWMDGRVPGHVPVLVVDDEADQASINTGDNRTPIREATDLDPHDYEGQDPDPDELSPSAINLAVRRLLGLFERCAYVAYTATPFANALIDPLALDVVGGVDLFPSDFILSLPPPPGEHYVGSVRLFGRDRLPGDSEDADLDGLDVIEIVPDHEVEMLIPPRREQDDFVPMIPRSLEQALDDFILAASARIRRDGEAVPCTMLVHTDMRRVVQNPLADSLEQRLAAIRQGWMYDRESVRPRLEERWTSRFQPVSRSVDVGLELSFSEIEDCIDRLLRRGIVVRRLNSDHPDELDFDIEPDLAAVVVGGNKLSRGVTLEGLLTSYYVRDSPYYDTLMQMGRWFGYRGSYVDLTRLYSTRKIVNWFHDLATAEEELRRHLAVYEKRNLKPTAIAPKIRTHPIMQITARSKMQDASEVSFSYDGEFRQTFHFPFDDVAMLRQNLNVTRRFLSRLGQPEWEEGRPCWPSVQPTDIQWYLSEYQTLTDDPIDPPSISQYIQAQVEQSELTCWRVLVCSARNPQARLGTEDLGVSGAPRIPLLARSRKLIPNTSCGVITDKDDETHGLSDAQKEQAEQEWNDRQYPTRAHAFRAQRSPEEGLLLIYPISRYSKPRGVQSGRVRRRQPLFDDPESGVTVVGYAVSFPFSESTAAVTYVAGPSVLGRSQ